LKLATRCRSRGVRNMLKVERLLAMVALAGALAYGREVLVAAQFVGRTVDVLLALL
jgi:hypothetical protein